MLSGNLYQKNIYFKNDMLFFQKNKTCRMFFVVRKGKQKLLFENCKCFFKKEKIVLKASFFWSVPPPPLATGLVAQQ